jgi:hypothetical protein
VVSEIGSIFYCQTISEENASESLGFAYKTNEKPFGYYKNYLALAFRKKENNHFLHPK